LVVVLEVLVVEVVAEVEVAVGGLPVPVVSVPVALTVPVVPVVPVVSVDIVPVVPVIEVSVVDVVALVLLIVDDESVATTAVSVTLLLFVSLLQAKLKSASAATVRRIIIFFMCVFLSDEWCWCYGAFAIADAVLGVPASPPSHCSDIES
jgi:hypothetical protein